MTEPSSPYGCLWIVGTPIGNADDISQRAINIISSASLVAAEDTRKGLWLLKHLRINTKLISCHQHNQMGRVDLVLSILAKGENVAYICDAGTPGVSDPGSLLIDAVVAAGYEVQAAPGPSAVTTAVSISGLAGAGYHFLGFLPRGKSRRRDELRILAASHRPMVLFESPRRILPLLNLIQDTLGDRQAVLCRELTKTHQQVLRGRISEIIDSLAARPRGEITLVISGYQKNQSDSAGADNQLLPDIESRAAELLNQGMSKPQAARCLVDETGGSISRKEAYSLVLRAQRPHQEIKFRAWGDPEIRASHDKTIEFTREKEINLRQTCVVGVEADWEPTDLKGLSGKGTITIKSGTVSDSFEVIFNPNFSSGQKIIFRRSNYTCAATLGKSAAKGASDLDPRLKEKLSTDQQEIEIFILTEKVSPWSPKSTVDK